MLVPVAVCEDLLSEGFPGSDIGRRRGRWRPFVPFLSSFSGFGRFVYFLDVPETPYSSHSTLMRAAAK